MQHLQHSIGRVIAYHGCEKEIAEKVLNNQDGLKASDNDFDWLGPGVYFWVGSPDRAADWALEHKKRGKIKETAVVGAIIHLGWCLNLTDYGVMKELRYAYQLLKAGLTDAGVDMPVNSIERDGIYVRRRLDCAVIKMIHDIRKSDSLSPYDTVYGVFEEGPEAYPGAGFKEKTHVQIAVRDPENCIIGYFRPQFHAQDVRPAIGNPSQR
jgi:hypothetical protein